MATNPKCGLVGCSNRALRLIRLINENGDCIVQVCRSCFENFVKDENTITVNEQARYAEDGVAISSVGKNLGVSLQSLRRTQQ